MHMKLKHFKIAAVLFAAGMLWFLGCEKNSTGPGNPLPVVKSIKAASKNLYINEATKVTCTAVDPDGQALSYTWSAPAGTFTKSDAAETDWTAPQNEGTYVLKCAASDANGMRWATVTVFVSLPPPLAACWPFDVDFRDIAGSNNGTAGDGVTITTDEFKIGTGCAKFVGTDGDVTSRVVAGTALGMGPDDSFTFMMWIKTSDVNGFLFGKTFDGNYTNGAKGLYISGEGNLVFDVWGKGDMGYETPVNDSEWHHVAFVKNGLSLSIYLDGELDSEDSFDEWSDDAETVITMGGASEEGDVWPGSYTGLMDDVRLYPRALIPDEILRVINAQ
jgi:hypothetical protein